MEKMIYNKPFLMSEKFVPQDYVAACPPDSEFVTYLFECNGTFFCVNTSVCYFSI
jgi:hypothetical protein